MIPPEGNIEMLKIEKSNKKGGNRTKEYQFKSGIINKFFDQRVHQPKQASTKKHVLNGKLKFFQTKRFIQRSFLLVDLSHINFIILVALKKPNKIALEYF